jgi:hypothetical protein
MVEGKQERVTKAHWMKDDAREALAKRILGVGAWPEMLGLQSSRFVLHCHDLEHGGRGMMFDFPRRGVNGGEAS